MATSKKTPAAKKKGENRVKPQDPVQVKWLGNFGGTNGRKKDEISTVHSALAAKLVEQKKVEIVEEKDEE